MIKQSRSTEGYRLYFNNGEWMTVEKCDEGSRASSRLCVSLPGSDGGLQDSSAESTHDICEDMSSDEFTATECNDDESCQGVPPGSTDIDILPSRPSKDYP